MNKRCGWLLLLVFLSLKSIAQQQDCKFMVVGYTRNNINLLEQVKHIKLKNITHLNIAFVNPDSAGNFIAPIDLHKVVKLAHRKHVLVLLSFGGGSPPKYLPALLAADRQTKLIDALVKLAVDNNADGIDVDLEGHMINQDYESFVSGLSASLKAHGKLMTAAIAGYYAERYTNKALARFDFVNIMSYDKTGPWNQAKPGQHAPYDMAVQDIAYWTGRGIPKEKLNLGVPFYAYGFGQGAPADMTYKDVVDQFPGAEDKDEVVLPAGGTMYYNGIPTIKAKTKLALDKAAGVMIWQLMQDANGKKSLLRAINKGIKNYKNAVGKKLD
ncbi:hypothetical protein DYU05_10140 [Mucilaginibacter terrenus]|uniref:chitinase n=1 Tax=Mucilaginibacter terrenus TaxID=2482727 RepID=A0A3E2NYA0_9SPHI|nr:glycosyl hydrolase family 18 protein [Mucilaginibacter terrenus]RFZ85919.1 hypothetical protein DYU05_10140 [Mucilaginibacter terrenus]